MDQPAVTPLCATRHYRLPHAIVFGLTDVGTVRNSNEDNFLIDETLGLAMVADGMGGHVGGEIASADTLTAIRDFLHSTEKPEDDAEQTLLPGAGQSAQMPDDPDATWSDQSMPAVVTMFDAIEAANHQLFLKNTALELAGGGGMGTTLTGFWQAAGTDRMVVFHVGDSRLYLCRSGELSQLTRDHTLYQQALDSGMLDNLPTRNLLMQAVGPAATVKPDVGIDMLQQGDVLMLCSDGLHGPVPHGEIEAILAGIADDDLEPACTRLVELAKSYGGRDNITALIARIAGGWSV